MMKKSVIWLLLCVSVLLSGCRTNHESETLDSENFIISTDAETESETETSAETEETAIETQPETEEATTVPETISETSEIPEETPVPEPSVIPDAAEEIQEQYYYDEEQSIQYFIDKWSDLPEEYRETTPKYDVEFYEATGLQIRLIGTQPEQAHQYFDILDSAYPGHFYGGDTYVGIDLDDAKIDDAWNIGQEECDRIVSEILASRDYLDVPIEDLLDINEYAMLSNSYGYISEYLSDTFNKSFTPGHFVEW